MLNAKKNSVAIIPSMAGMISNLSRNEGMATDARETIPISFEISDNLLSCSSESVIRLHSNYTPF